MDQIFVWLVIGILFVWLGVITYIILMQRNQYAVFTKGSKAETLSGLLSSILESVELNQKNIKDVQNHCQSLEKAGKLHIQKIGLLRFNPFRDTGGDQSFSLALVDSYDSGIVISALYSRSGTRWYAKSVRSGKGEEFELSEEENRAIKLAKAIKTS